MEVVGLSYQKSKEAIKCQIELMEKEILYFKGKNREVAKEKYYQLLHLCGNSCSIDSPIYLKRSE